MYEAPEVEKMNNPTPSGINDYVWMHTVAVGESYVVSMIAGIFFQVAFQFDTTYPVSVNNDVE